jgi:hypothetical protein
MTFREGSSQLGAGLLMLLHEPELLMRLNKLTFRTSLIVCRQRMAFKLCTEVDDAA